MMTSGLMAEWQLIQALTNYYSKSTELLSESSVDGEYSQH